MWGVCRDPWASTAADNTPWIPTTIQRFLVVHLLDEEDAPYPSCLVGPRVAAYTWQMILDLHDSVASPTLSS